MKVILSRKGFDSSFGGYPSPILTNDRLLSLPIPSSDETRYSDLMINETKTYYDVMSELKPYIRYRKKSHKITQNTRCHLDPDLYRNILQRNVGWKPCFGQINQSQSHLSNEGVNINDLFLYFGWFKKTIIKNDQIRFDSSASDLHVIFGYLQIGDIIQVNSNTNVPNWMKIHPHACNEDRKKISNNTIYVAREKVTWNENINGAGVFKFNDELILTKKGFTRSKWDLPNYFKNVRISRHSKKSWNEDYFKSVDIGQEFVIEENDNINNWAKNLIEKYRID